MADQELTPQQRAATVIVALGTDKASRIYQYMGPDELEQLTLEVAKLGHVPTERTDQVLEELYQMCLTNKAVTEGGMEYARSVLQKAFGDQAADREQFFARRKQENVEVIMRRIKKQ